MIDISGLVFILIPYSLGMILLYISAAGIRISLEGYTDDYGVVWMMGSMFILMSFLFFLPYILSNPLFLFMYFPPLILFIYGGI